MKQHLERCRQNFADQAGKRTTVRKARRRVQTVVADHGETEE